MYAPQNQSRKVTVQEVSKNLGNNLAQTQYYVMDGIYGFNVLHNSLKLFKMFIFTYVCRLKRLAGFSLTPTPPPSQTRQIMPIDVLCMNC